MRYSSGDGPSCRAASRPSSPSDFAVSALPAPRAGRLTDRIHQGRAETSWRLLETFYPSFGTASSVTVRKRSAPDRIRTCNPQIRSHEPEQTPQTSDDLPEKKSGDSS